MLFERQLASGLWDAPDDAGRLLATARVFVRCHEAGIDGTHAVFGAQLKKAVDATIALAVATAAKGEAEDACAAALVAASRVATGRRQRAEIRAAVKASPSARVRAVEPALASPEAALAEAKALGA